ncbi:phage late control D family protein [Kamptonema formosum]|uniref:phage late control D family protein n=1 Tax=Kamptonema formosum TaxID=331992 RepID=UPI00034CA56F|nr:contractile injection system protein, VgrG/Pvc8 family [Oscillatoria sp. PCC 10802]
MPKPTDVQLLVPQIQVLIKGTRLPLNAEADLISATVSEDLEALGMFALEMVNWDTIKGKVTWSDSALFDVGNQVELQMGYKNNLKTLMVGEIAGLEPEFSREEVPRLVVRGYDLRHRLSRGRKTRSFTKMKDSDIAGQIARARGLTAQVKDTKVKLDYVLQANQTDLEFLQERAGRIGYEVAVENKTLLFRPHQNNSQKVLTLKWDEDIIEFTPRMSAMNQVSQVEVHSWNPKQKKALIGKAGAGSETTTMKGSTSGPKEANKAFGKATNVIVSEPAATQAEADQIAMGQFNEMALAYITGEGICAGQPEVRAGKVIEIAGAGKRFSGLYYVISATHTYSQDRGYRTEFSVRRNAT